MVRDDNSSPIGRTFKAVTPNKSRERESTISRRFNRDTQQENQIVGSSCTDGITRKTTVSDLFYHSYHKWIQCNLLIKY